MAQTFARLHRHRWQHGALFPTHVLVRQVQGGFRVALLDLEKMRRRLFIRQASHHDLRQFLRRQRFWDEGQIRFFLTEYKHSLVNLRGEPAGPSPRDFCSPEG